MKLVTRPPLLDHLHAGHAVLEASAGTGKTFALEHLVADLLLSQGLRLEEILVVTFTTKAAQELKTRVRTILTRLLEQAQSPSSDPNAWPLDEQSCRRIEAALSNFDSAPIHTIHGFCLRVLQESAFDCGRLLKQEAASKNDLFERAFKDLIRTRFTKEPKLHAMLTSFLSSGRSLDWVQQCLATGLQERKRLDAPAEFLSPLEALNLDWIEHSGELAAHLKTAKIHPSSAKAIVSLLNELASVIRTWKQDGDIPSLVSILNAQLEKIEKQVDNLGKAELSRELEAIHLALQALAIRIPSQEMILVEEFLPPLLENLETLKQAEGLYDFDDMVDGLETALEGPSGKALKSSLRDKFKIALIDEFQDTDASQWKIFETIFRETPQRLVLVGDPKQAIYGFRGGDLPTYFSATSQVLAGRPAVVLDQNFRSTSKVIDAINRILETEFFDGSNRYPHPVQCGKPDLRLQDAQGNELPPLKILEIEPSSSSSEMMRSLARNMAIEIRDFILTSPRLGDAALDFGDVFVLTSKTSEAQIMAAALREFGVPFAFFKQEGLFQTEEALWILDLLKAIDSPLDPTRKARALLTPFFGIGLADLQNAAELSEEHPAIEMLQGWSMLARQKRLPELFNRIVDESGVLLRLRQDSAFERKATNLRHILELLLETGLSSHHGFKELVRILSRWVEAVELPEGENGNLQRLEGERRAVQILTMHKSKGLEAPVVAIFGGFTSKRNGSVSINRYVLDGKVHVRLGKLPGYLKTLVGQEESEEDQRLLYVALTRAKGRLILPYIKGGETFDPKGRIGILNRRLRTLIESGHSAFQIQKTEGAWPLALPTQTDKANPILFDPEPDYARLRNLARPLGVTSFTAMEKRFQEEEDPEPSMPGKASIPGDLPGGPETGILLHALMEQVDIESAKGSDLVTWMELPLTRALLMTALQRAAFAPAMLETTGKYIYAALSSELPLACVAMRDLDPAKALREIRFLTPLPEAQDLLTGFIDLLFWHEGKAYILDWKSNLLPDYDQETLQTCMDEHYRLQVQIYTLATLRFLEIKNEDDYASRFGGVIYVFMRGLPDEGRWSLFPTWDEVLTWKANLAQMNPFELGAAR